VGAYRRDAVKGGRAIPYFPFAFDATWVRDGTREPIRFSWRDDDRPCAAFRGRVLAADELDELLDLLPGGGELHVAIPVRLRGEDGSTEDAPLALAVARVPDPRGGRLTRFRVELAFRGQAFRAEENEHLEGAFDRLRRDLWPRACLVCCACCWWSRYVDGAGWGELSCRASGAREPTDEPHRCDAYAPRPPC